MKYLNNFVFVLYCICKLFARTTLLDIMILNDTHSCIWSTKLKKIILALFINSRKICLHSYIDS